MITLPVWAFILCIAGPIVIAGAVSACAILLYIGKGMFG
jgi:hypothetical protein